MYIFWVITIMYFVVQFAMIAVSAMIARDSKSTKETIMRLIPITVCSVLVVATMPNFYSEHGRYKGNNEGVKIGYEQGYKDGQVDAIKGVIKYEKVTETTERYERKQEKK